MATFLLLRHGTPMYDLADRRRLKGGARDWVPLAPEGILQIEQAAERLRGQAVDLVLSSPMTRALQSAAMLSRTLGLPLTVEFDLHEWLPDVNQAFDSVAEVLAAAREMEECGGEWPAGQTRQWEPLSSVHRRVEAVLGRYAQLGTVIVACHGTVIQALTGKALACGESVPFPMHIRPL